MKALRSFWIGALVAPVIVLALAAAVGDVSLPHTFVAGTTASADEVNANFQALATAIDELRAAHGRRSIHIPAGAMTYDPFGGDQVSPVHDALRIDLSADYGAGPRWVVSKPPDYAGGDVTVQILFRPSDTTEGTASFIVCADQQDDGDPPSAMLPPCYTASAGPKEIGGGSFSTMPKYYCETVVIPAVAVSKKIWRHQLNISTDGPTYEGDIDILGVTLEYDTLAP